MEVYGAVQGHWGPLSSLLDDICMLFGYYEALWGHLRDPGGTLGSTLMHLGSTWTDFRSPWEIHEIILELSGSILGCLGHPKPTQSAPGWHMANIVKTCENHVFFCGFEMLEAFRMAPT